MYVLILKMTLTPNLSYTDKLKLIFMLYTCRIFIILRIHIPDK